MKILGLCGSLRENSTNALLLKAAKKELNSAVWLDFDLSQLPYFEPDQQYSDQIPRSVQELRRFASQADLIFLCTPEYAHGIPGVLKNALEWMFHEGTQKKPVWIVLGSTQGEHTKAQLIEVLSTMDFSVREDQVLLLKGARSWLTTEGSFKETSIQNVFFAFMAAVSKSL